MSDTKDQVGIFLQKLNKVRQDIPAFRLDGTGLVIQCNKVSTGISSFDEALYGGIPRGRVVEVYGPESSGKTTFTLSIIAAAQRANPGKVITVYIDAEHALDPSYMQRIGCNLKDIIIQQPDWGEQALDLVKTVCQIKAAMPELQDQILIVVVDSIAALVPKAEYDEEKIEDSGGLGTAARMMSKAMRQIIRPISQSDACAMFVNQVRENIGGYGGYVTPGGKALKFYASLRLDVRRTGKWEGSGGKILGIKSKFTVIKSKLFPPLKVVDFFIGNNGIDLWQMLFDDALNKKVIKKGGAWYKFGDISLGQGADKALDYVRKNADIAQKIANACKSGAPPEVEAIDTTLSADPQISVDDAKEVMSNE